MCMGERRNIIIEYVANEGYISEIMSNIGVRDNDKSDFGQEIYLILLEYDIDKLQAMYERQELKWFIVKIIKNQYYSQNSPYYKKYKKYYKIIDENFTRNNLVEKDDDNIDE